MEKEYKLTTILRVGSAILLIIAIGSHPYSYYQILRWIIAGSSIYSGWVFSELKLHNWAWAFFIIGILFNSIIPVYLDKSTWQLIDIVVAIVFMWSLKANDQIQI